MSKSSAKAATQNSRGLHSVVNKIDLHTRTLVRLEEKLDIIKRAVTKYDKPVSMGQLRANPDLNPWLQGHLPFADQASVDHFFESTDRNYELGRWVLDTIKWNTNTFVPRMLDAICTKDYRIRYSFPGKST